jgi:hypothetical protein
LKTENHELFVKVIFIALILFTSMLFYQVHIRVPYEQELTIQSVCRNPLRTLKIESSTKSLYYSGSDFTQLTPLIGHYYPMGGWMKWLSSDAQILLKKYFTVLPGEETVICFTWIEAPFQINSVDYHDDGDDIIHPSDPREAIVTIWGEKNDKVEDFIDTTLTHYSSYTNEKWNSQYLYKDTIENLESRMLTSNGYIEVWPNLPNFWSDDTGKLVTALIDYYNKASDQKTLDLIWHCNQLLFSAQNELSHFWTRKYVGPVYVSSGHEHEEFTSVRNWLIEFNYNDQPMWFRRDGCDCEFQWEPKIYFSPRVEIKPVSATQYQTKMLKDYNQISTSIITETEENVTVRTSYSDSAFPTVYIYVTILKAEPSVEIWFTYESISELDGFRLYYGFEGLEEFWTRNHASGVGPRYCYVQGRVIERVDQNPMLITNDSGDYLVLFDNSSSLRGRMILLSFKNRPSAVYDNSNGDLDGDSIKEYGRIGLRYDLGSINAGERGENGTMFLTLMYEADTWQWQDTIKKVCHKTVQNLLDSGTIGMGGFELSDMRNQAPIIESLLNSALFWKETSHSYRGNACFETGIAALDSYLESLRSGRALSGYELGYLLIACSHAYRLTSNNSYRVWEEEFASKIINQQISDRTDIRYGGYIDSQAIHACHLDVVSVFLLALNYAYNDFGYDAYRESAEMCIENWIHVDSNLGAWGYREGYFSSDGGGQTNKQGFVLKALVAWDYIELAKEVAEYFFKYPIPPYGLAPVAPTFNDPWGASWDINSETLAWSLSGLSSLIGL